MMCLLQGETSVSAGSLTLIGQVVMIEETVSDLDMTCCAVVTAAPLDSLSHYLFLTQNVFFCSFTLPSGGKNEGSGEM